MPEIKRRRNFVFLEGYLKENTLEKVTLPSGDEAIRGSVTIAISQDESYKVTFNVGKLTKDGAVRKDYEKVEKILRVNTLSIANYLKSTPTATFDLAKNQASKVYITGSFEEYAVIENGKERSSITIRGTSGGLKTAEDRHPFNPRATFELDVFIESKEFEERDGEKTGRLEITGLIPTYNGGMHRIKLIAAAQKIVDYLDKNYFVNQTANFCGVLSCIKIENKRDNVDPNSWGSAAEVVTETRFVRERIITGGVGSPKNCDAEGAITRQEVKDGLVIRDEQVTKATKARAGKADPGKPAESNSVPEGFTNTAQGVGADEFNFSEEDF